MDTIRYHGWFCNTTWGALTEDERHHNGMRLAQGLYNFGWTEEAIAGILGNVAIRAGEGHCLECHVDTEEANALAITSDTTFKLIK